jgi:iron(III) transport system ATP-binding protein
MNALEVKSISIRYDDPNAPQGFLQAVSSVSFTLGQGKIGCLLGPSGCGKTSILRAVAGFIGVSEGEILLNGQSVSGAGHWVAPEKRNIGVVFQDYALFPHLTVAENVAFGLTKGKRFAAGGLPAAAKDMIALVGLKEQSDTTAILVTHDQHEAFAIADEVGVLFNGELAQWGDPYQLYHEPNSMSVARFVGEGALISGAQHGHQVDTPFGQLPLKDCCCDEHCDAQNVRVLLRPDDVVHDDAATMKARVVRKSFRGADFLYTLELPNGEQILSLVPSHHNHALDEPIGVRLEADHVVTFADSEPAAPF